MERLKPKVKREEYEPERAPTVLPIPPPEVPYVDRGPEVVASTLAPQLGTDATELARGRADMRRLSVIEERDIPFLIYAKIRGRKTRVWDMVYDMYLNLKVSVGGRGRKDIIRMEGVARGGLPEIAAEFQKPGWIQRNITQRDWRKKLELEGM